MSSQDIVQNKSFFDIIVFMFFVVCQVGWGFPLPVINPSTILYAVSIFPSVPCIISDTILNSFSSDSRPVLIALVLTRYPCNRKTIWYAIIIAAGYDRVHASDVHDPQGHIRDCLVTCMIHGWHIMDCLVTCMIHGQHIMGCCKGVVVFIVQCIEIHTQEGHQLKHESWQSNSIYRIIIPIGHFPFMQQVMVDSILLQKQYLPHLDVRHKMTEVAVWVLQGETDS